MFTSISAGIGDLPCSTSFYAFRSLIPNFKFLFYLYLMVVCSLISAAIVMRHYVEANLSRKSHTTLKYAMKVVRLVAYVIFY